MMNDEITLHVNELENIPTLFDKPAFLYDYATGKISCIEFTNAKPSNGASLSADSRCTQEFHNEFLGEFYEEAGWEWRYTRHGEGAITLMYCCNPTASDYERIISKIADDARHSETDSVALAQRLARGNFKELAHMHDDTAQYYARHAKRRLKEIIEESLLHNA